MLPAIYFEEDVYSLARVRSGASAVWRECGCTIMPTHPNLSFMRLTIIRAFQSGFRPNMGSPGPFELRGSDSALPRMLTPPRALSHSAFWGFAALLCGAALFTPTAALALADIHDPFVFRRWGVQDGLPQSSVTGLVIDGLGFVWGGTYGGIFRFDGQRIIPQRGASGEPIGSSFNSLALSRTGGIWASDLDGNVVRIENGQVVDRLPNFGDSAPARTQARLTEGADGTLWAWAGNAILAWTGAPDADGVAAWKRIGEARRQWPGGELFPLTASSLIAGSYQSAEDPNPARFFQVSVARGIEFDLGPPFDTDGEVGALARDRSGRLWAIVHRSLIAFEGDGRLEILPFNARPDVIAPAPDGSIWIAGVEGVTRLIGPGLTEPGTLSPTTVRLERQLWTGLSAPVVLSATVTRDNVLLLGLLGEGLWAVSPRVGALVPLSNLLFQPSTQPSATSREIHSVLADRLGGVWVSKECGPVIRVTGVGPNATGLAQTAALDTCATSLALDTLSGTAWVGSQEGLFRVTPEGEVLRRPFPESLQSSADDLNLFASAILLLGPDDLLVGMSDGRLFRHRIAGRFEALPEWPGRGSGLISALARTDDGVWLVGQGGSVLRIRPDGSPISSLNPDANAQGQVRSIVPEANGGIWVASYGAGVSYHAPEGWSRELPLQDQSVSALIFDEDRNLWIFQNTGSARFGAAYLDAVRRGIDAPTDRRRMSETDGLSEVTSGRPAAAFLPSGVLLVATINGLVWVDPTRLSTETFAPTPRIEFIRTPKRNLYFPRGTIELDPDERVAEIQLAIPSFRSSDQVFVRHRIVRRGGPGEWFTPMVPGLIQLAGLLPGRFQLEIEVALSGSTWVPAPTLSVHVIPTLGERRDVQALFLLLPLILILLVLRAQNRARESREQAHLERERFEERQRHLDELSLLGRHALAGELSASLTHELGQPVTALLHTATALKSELALDTLDKTALEETADELILQANRARGILTGLRRFLRTGEPEREPTVVEDLIETIIKIAQPDLARDRIRIRAELPDSPLPALVAEGVLIQQAILILISNAADAVRQLPPKRRDVLVRVSATGTPGTPTAGLRFSICDSGIGIAKDRIGRLFDTFYSGKKDGMGMGLPIARRIILSHGGSISIRSRELRGTVASFTLPLSPL
jgi:signal transduction histidine kinase/ligand-binding sensor domain-containing protein